MTVYTGGTFIHRLLKDNQTSSTLKTSSSKGGSGFNELRFEDMAGSEEIFLQAQKHMTTGFSLTRR